MTPLDVYVAVDIAGGKVVRLTQGRIQDQTVYGQDPVATAKEWERRGAGWLHVVDLDGAIKGESQNAGTIEDILSSAGIPVQVSGGVRSIEAIRRWLERGASRVVLGTKALDEEFLSRALAEFGERVVAAVDSRAGVVQVAGWREQTAENPVAVARRLESAGVARLMFTDIDRDGTLLGPDLDAIGELLDAVGVPVIASGGVSSAADVQKLAALSPRGLEGVIVGKALYSGALTLEAAKEAAGG